MAYLVVRMSIPKLLLKSFLRLISRFDKLHHDDIVISWTLDAPEMDEREMRDLLEMEPPLPPPTAITKNNSP